MDKEEGRFSSPSLCWQLLDGRRELVGGWQLQRKWGKFEFLVWSFSVGNVIMWLWKAASGWWQMSQSLHLLLSDIHPEYRIVTYLSIQLYRLLHQRSPPQLEMNSSPHQNVQILWKHKRDRKMIIIEESLMCTVLVSQHSILQINFGSLAKLVLYFSISDPFCQAEHVRKPNLSLE